MSTEKINASDAVSAGLITNPSGAESALAGGVYTVECVGADGKVKWTDSFHNLVVNEGLQDMNTKYFQASGYTAAWYLGLVTGPGASNTYAAGNTLVSHTWTENTNYSGTRKAAVFGTATTANPSVLSNTASPAVFTMTANSQVIAGAFLCSVASGTSGVLFSVGNFSGGDKSVDSGDTLNVTYQFSLAAA